MTRPFPILILMAAIVYGDHRKENEALLGVVTVQDGEHAVVVHVLERSPADQSKLKAGDRLLEIGAKAIRTPADVDAALAGAKPREKLAVAYEREGERREAKARLVARSDYKGGFLDRRARGATGFEAPVGYGAHVHGAYLSVVMHRFGTGGTPWTIVVDKKGVVRMNEVTPESADAVAKLIEKLR